MPFMYDHPVRPRSNEQDTDSNVPSSSSSSYSDSSEEVDVEQEPTPEDRPSIFSLRLYSFFLISSGNLRDNIRSMFDPRVPEPSNIRVQTRQTSEGIERCIKLTWFEVLVNGEKLAAKDVWDRVLVYERDLNITAMRYEDHRFHVPDSRRGWVDRVSEVFDDDTSVPA